MRKLPRITPISRMAQRVRVRTWLLKWPRRQSGAVEQVASRCRCLLAAGLLLMAGAAGCKQSTAAGAGGRPPTLVVAADVIAQDVPVYLDEIGTCVARESVNIEPQVSGRLTAIYFQDGADLKKGDKLFTIDPRPYEAALAGAEAQLEKDNALAANSRANSVRQEMLFEKKLVSPADYDQARYTADSQDASVKIDAAMVQTAKLNLEYCSIASPIDGRAGLRLVDVGNVVQSDKDTSLLSIQRLDPIYVDFTATESDLPAIRRNMADGSLKVAARVPAGLSASPTTLPADEPGRTGTLTFLDNMVTGGNGTIKLRATIPNSDHLFWPGQFVRVRLILKTIRDATLIPVEAVQLSQQGNFVYVIQPDHTVQPRPVTVGQRQGEHQELVAIESGLKKGERVVVIGQLLLSPGAAVMETPAGPTTQSGGGAASGAQSAGTQAGDSKS
jgi:multidrug efflux system membrane fusion protein